MLKTKKLHLILALVVAIGAVTLAWGGRERASGLVGLPFGGPILSVGYCCNGTTITVGPPRPGYFLITAGSILYPYYNVYTPGPYVLGTAVPGGVCAQIPYCFVTIPTTGTVTMVGSSGL